MPRHYKGVPNVHLRKHWDRDVKTWFDQAARKYRRRQARVEKAKATFPRPVDGALRPLVHSQTQRYNMKIRIGRGFSLAELQKAGINGVDAKKFQITIDHRRRSESLDNVQRLKNYRSRIIEKPEATVVALPKGALNTPRQAPLKVKAISA
ncbi:putative 60S ribosomal protein L13 [Paratrimastix pyriformis]|uniref:60S ribosomal protein L13 n=1 Tax=Paratrimastix pyriformis TaxID=342808 RepID=A0ABQ8UEC2_9EUKA|nr:putative 60S ribosomal protein L13 [Paratrimastix pyriformis]|eukprot:EC834412.1.p2 GENE.EC834412.1~~EC834412.1.p2  ORF type:complete len:151 (+),score=54.71 EC834412.1:27-479(+)